MRNVTAKYGQLRIVQLRSSKCRQWIAYMSEGCQKWQNLREERSVSHSLPRGHVKQQKNCEGRGSVISSRGFFCSKIEWCSLRDKCIIQKPFQVLAKAGLEDAYRSLHTEVTISLLVACICTVYYWLLGRFFSIANFSGVFWKGDVGAIIYLSLFSEGMGRCQRKSEKKTFCFLHVEKGKENWNWTLNQKIPMHYATTSFGFQAKNKLRCRPWDAIEIERYRSLQW